MDNDENIKKLNDLFGSYRAEWLQDEIFNLFSKPSYFNGLQDNRPCVLEGGRGTGKTTVLRGLSYQGQYAFHNKDIELFDKETNYIGIYHKIDTNHVRAFSGGNIKDDMWMKYFAHYFNLIIAKNILSFLDWHKDLRNSDEMLSPEICTLISLSLFIKKSNDSKSLINNIKTGIYELQGYLNCIGDHKNISLSLSGDPIKLITDEISKLSQFKDKMFYILLDEYENFSDYQQQVVNSLIKHSTTYSFKIAVRELGWRVKYTLNKEELLIDEADYIPFNIERTLTKNNYFDEFAKEVCQQRISQLLKNKEQEEYSIEDSLAKMTYEEEAIVLGGGNLDYIKEIKELPASLYGIINHLPDLYLFFIGYWAEMHKKSLEDTVSDYKINTTKWDTRYGNYKYEMLFKIRRGRGASGIKKYYTGWDTFVKLAAGNIRYLMELVYHSYEKHLQSENNIEDTVSCKTQTEAAHDVGKMKLIQLENLWLRGAELTKLILSLGRIFELFARKDGKRAPEINQFSIEDSRMIKSETRDLLAAGVMNLALIRETGNKLGEAENTKDYTYSIHPILAPFFVFSFRKKRKIILTEDNLLGLINNTKSTIKGVLKERHIIENQDTDIPTQLLLFEEFYND